MSSQVEIDDRAIKFISLTWNPSAISAINEPDWIRWTNDRIWVHLGVGIALENMNMKNQSEPRRWVMPAWKHLIELQTLQRLMNWNLSRLTYLFMAHSSQLTADKRGVFMFTLMWYYKFDFFARVNLIT